MSKRGKQANDDGSGNGGKPKGSSGGADVLKQTTIATPPVNRIATKYDFAYGAQTPSPPQPTPTTTTASSYLGYSTSGSAGFPGEASSSAAYPPLPSYFSIQPTSPSHQDHHHYYQQSRSHQSLPPLRGNYGLPRVSPLADPVSSGINPHHQVADGRGGGGAYFSYSQPYFPTSAASEDLGSVYDTTPTTAATTTSPYSNIFGSIKNGNGNTSSSGLRLANPDSRGSSSSALTSPVMTEPPPPPSSSSAASLSPQQPWYQQPQPSTSSSSLYGADERQSPRHYDGVTVATTPSSPYASFRPGSGYLSSELGGGPYGGTASTASPTSPSGGAGAGPVSSSSSSSPYSHYSFQTPTAPPHHHHHQSHHPHSHPPPPPHNSHGRSPSLTGGGGGSNGLFATSSAASGLGIDSPHHAARHPSHHHMQSQSHDSLVHHNNHHPHHNHQYGHPSPSSEFHIAVGTGALASPSSISSGNSLNGGISSGTSAGANGNSISTAASAAGGGSVNLPRISPPPQGPSHPVIEDPSLFDEDDGCVGMGGATIGATGGLGSGVGPHRRGLAPLQSLQRSHPYKRDPLDDQALRMLGSRKPS
jgi:hypothetical protein